MKTLRLMTMMALASGMLLAGCGDSGRTGTDEDGGMEEDSDVGLMDSGGGGDDSGSGTDSGGGGTDSGGGGTDSGGGGGGMCPDGPCDILTNDGCEAGQGCYFVTTMEGTPPSPMCLTAGTGGDGADCEMVTDCQEGFLCDTSAGVCRHYCCMGSDDGCPTGQRCLVNLVDDAGDPLGVGFCKFPDDCDPVEQTGCDGGQACYPAGPDGSVSCAAPGDGTQGEGCSAANDCAGGFACIGDPATCAQFCNPMDSDPGCPSGTTCGGLMGFPDDVGVCASGG